MQLSVLGPVRLTGPDGEVTVGDRKARQVLTLLALAAPRPLSVDALARLLWDDPPPSAVKTVQAHVSRLRTALARAGGKPGVLSGGPAGYQLVPGVDELDVQSVDALCRRARIATLDGDDHGAAQLLHRARRTWRGDPELPATTTGDAEATRLTEKRLGLVEDHLTALAHTDRPGDTLAELEALCRQHPLRERLHALRVTVLYRGGRQAEALYAYRSVRQRLVDELGVDPGPELRAAEQAVLVHALPRLHPGSGDRRVEPTIAVEVPRYAHGSGVHVAYGTYGDGPVDVLLLDPTFVPVDAHLEEPHLADALTRLADGRRVISLDRRGLGLSDPVSDGEPPTVEQWADDAISVLDATEATSAHVLANDSTAMVALLLAARHPHRIATLTLLNGYARATCGDGYPHGSPAGDLGETLRDIHTPSTRPTTDVLSWIAPSVAEDARFRTWWDAVGRRGASPRTAALVHQLITTADVRDVLAGVVAPVLLLSRTGCASNDPGHSRYLAGQLPDATLVEHDDPDGPWFLGDVGWVMAQFTAFVARSRPTTRTATGVPRTGELRP